MSRPLTRSNSTSPLALAAWLSTLLIAGGDTCSISAALLTPPAAITARKTSICRRFIGLPGVNLSLTAGPFFSLGACCSPLENDPKARSPPWRAHQETNHAPAASPAPLHGRRGGRVLRARLSGDRARA